MNAEIFFNELGNEPFSYIGYVHPRFTGEYAGNAIHALISLSDIRLRNKLELQNALHYSKSPEALLKLKIGVGSVLAKHRLIVSSENTLSLKLTVFSAIHKLSTYNKINAPVDFTCNRYLHTAYESRILQTPSKVC